MWSIDRQNFTCRCHRRANKNINFIGVAIAPDVAHVISTLLSFTILLCGRCSAMFVFQLVFERGTDAVNIVIRTNNIPFVFDDHCSPFKMKNTRGREERTKGREKWRKEGEIGFRLPDEWRQCQESAAAAPEQISLKNSALLVRRRKKKIRRRREKVAVSSAAVKRRERERVVTRNFGQLDRHRPLFQCW